MVWKRVVSLSILALATGVALSGVASCKTDDNDPCPSGKCGGSPAADAATQPDTSTTGAPCSGPADCAPTERCSFARAACGAKGQCERVGGPPCSTVAIYACSCSGKVITTRDCLIPEPIVGGLKASPNELPCGAAGDGGPDSGEGGTTSDGGDGGSCPAPSCTLGAANSCNCDRPGAAAAYAMVCDGTNCTCTKSGLTQSGSPFGQSTVVPDPCSSIAQAAFVMNKNCGACL